MKAYRVTVIVEAFESEEKLLGEEAEFSRQLVNHAVSTS